MAITADEVIQRLLESVSLSHGRILVYAWAIEQDPLSKRAIPTTAGTDILNRKVGQDVLVPWVASTSSQSRSKQTSHESSLAEDGQEPRIYNRYYHMFAEGELLQLVEEACQNQGLYVGMPSEASALSTIGVEIVRHGWERSNYYIELRTWQKG
jgi:tRNA (uracil-5-)-methyltransferase TRM9